MLVTNAFSINMLNDAADLRFMRITAQSAAELLELEHWRSCVGHADTARVMSAVLGTEIPANRVTVNYDGTEKMLVGQYKGPRLPEGATELPQGAHIEWWLVEDISKLKSFLIEELSDELDWVYQYLNPSFKEIFSSRLVREKNLFFRSLQQFR